MDPPDTQLDTTLHRNLDQQVDHSNALESRLEHAEEEFFSVEFGSSFLVAIKTES